MKVIEVLPLESSIDDAFDEENRSAYDLFTTEQPIIYENYKNSTSFLVSMVTIILYFLNLMHLSCLLKLYYMITFHTVHGLNNSSTDMFIALSRS